MTYKILIVDDQPEMLQLLGMAFEEQGYEIEVAQTAKTTLKKIKQGQPDLVILDIMLPGMSGVEICKLLRSDPKTANLPIVLLSALADVETKIAGLQAGADEYITKPVDPREMVARVVALLERTERLREASSDAKGRILTVLGSKGGVGTTTVTLNVAGTLVKNGSSVVAAELVSSQGSFSHHMGLASFRHLGDLLDLYPKKVDRKELKRNLSKHPTGLQLLCSSPEPGLHQDLSPEFVESLIDSLTREADFVVVDVPSRLDVVSQAILGQSDCVLIVLEPTPIGLDAAKAICELVRLWASGASMIGCIAVNRSGIASSLTTAELEAELGIPVLGIVPQAGDPLASAYRQKQLLVFAQPGHGAAEGISTITKALLNL